MSDVGPLISEKTFRPSVSKLRESIEPRRPNRTVNRLEASDRPAHNWYRFVLSFPPHLVRDYLQRFGVDSTTVCLDPFCGTGTTPVECKKLGVPSVGIESHPMSFFAAQVKTDWGIDPAGLREHGRLIARQTASDLEEGFTGSGLRGLSEEAHSLLLANSISPLPLHKTLILLDRLNETKDSPFYRHELLALAQALVTEIGNLHFGPEVGVGRPKSDAPVVEAWLRNVEAMAADVEELRRLRPTSSTIVRADSRDLLNVVEPRGEDIIEEQVLQQIKAVFHLTNVVQDFAVPLALKSISASRIHIVEYGEVRREDAEALDALTLVNQAVFELVPAVPGIGK